MYELKAKEYKRFEEIKHVRDDGTEYWSARELAVALDYIEWRNFQKVIQRAMIACENSGHSILNDFVEANKIVEAGATAKPIKDYELSRYACYLIVQNGDPRKEVIAIGQEIARSRIDFLKECGIAQHFTGSRISGIGGITEAVYTYCDTCSIKSAGPAQSQPA